MARTDRASRVIAAPLADVFHALVDRHALESWLAPEGMTARFEHFDPRPGGSYQLVLTYLDAATAAGKTDPDADVVEVRYVDIVPGERVVQAVDFASDDPAFAGTMEMTWSVHEATGGARVDIVATNVPDGITAEDHAAGMSSSLENLARHLAR